MKQGTTYPIIITIPGIDLTGAEWFIVSIRPNYRPTMEFSGDRLSVSADASGTAIALALTQEESIALNPGGATVDVNWMLDGIRGGCVPAAISITDTLLRRVVEG